VLRVDEVSPLEYIQKRLPANWYVSRVERQKYGGFSVYVERYPDGLHPGQLGKYLSRPYPIIGLTLDGTEEQVLEQLASLAASLDVLTTIPKGITLDLHAEQPDNDAR
jgi:hypothetical protein